MTLQLTPDDWLVLVGMAVTVASFGLMLVRRG
jgi:hypothetical protein